MVCCAGTGLLHRTSYRSLRRMALIALPARIQGGVWQTRYPLAWVVSLMLKHVIDQVSITSGNCDTVQRQVGTKQTILRCEFLSQDLKPPYLHTDTQQSCVGMLKRLR